MILYDTRNWGNTLIKIYLSFNKAYTTRILFRDILIITVYAAIIVVVDIEFLTQKLHIDPLFFSLLGVILSLMLVFRLNSSYNKWWEGRTAWGALINNSRAFASNLNSLIPKEDKELRRYFATQISNFAIALQGHLRDDVNFSEFEKLDAAYDEALGSVKHVPHKIVTMLFEKIELLVKSGLFSKIDTLSLKPQLERFLDILGICERIKNTPIPFSHNSYIKTFILIYVFALPFGIVSSLEYYAIPAVSLISYALVGVEVISEEIEEPFGRQANDLPLIHLSNIIKENTYEALEVAYTFKVPSVEVDNEYIVIIH
ncbi:MAG: bestrophin family ion channel [Microscillaceae bacterium]|nr:bestrophin family ion channel [Microscillaceae bacterium]